MGSSRSKLSILKALCFASVLFGTAILADAAPARHFHAGESYFGRSNYVEYLPGTLPIIISAPHGGSLTPDEIPNRVRTETSKDFVTVRDGGTVELAMAVRTAFHEYFGAYPHVIICRLRRTKVDCNRDAEEGTGGNPLSLQAWNEFHDFINSASNQVVTTHSNGFYIDLHGHGHAIKRLELGYLLKGMQLTNSDASLNQGEYAQQSSVRGLAARSPNSFSEILRGPRSLGAMLVQRGFPSIPSPRMPSPGMGTTNTVYPGVGNPYFSGGYNTWLHTSADSGGPVDGVQIETYYCGLRDHAFNRARFGRALAEALQVYFREHYGRNLKDRVPMLQSPKESDAE
jgi:hypothetical protein